MQAVSRDEFETVKQLLASAARYAESANRQSEQNATLIADNAEGIQALKLIQAENAALIKQNANAIAALENKLGELVDIQQKTEQRLEAFIFESQRLISSNKGTIDQLKALCDRYDGVLAYLMRKEQSGDSA